MAVADPPKAKREAGYERLRYDLIMKRTLCVWVNAILAFKVSLNAMASYALSAYRCGYLCNGCVPIPSNVGHYDFWQPNNQWRGYKEWLWR